MDFTNKSVIVTGASTGIGRELAREFARRGASVLVNYASSEAKAEETVALIGQAGGRAVPCRGDVSVEADADAVVRAAADAFGGVDVLVNNAGRTVFAAFADLDAISARDWQDIMGVNVAGAFNVSRAAARHMAANGGSIVNIASIAGHRPAGSSIPYCASKAALLMLTRCLAKTLGPKIRVNSVSPGFIAETAWNDKRDQAVVEEGKKLSIETSALKRAGTPKDLVGAVLYLASEEAGFCTGADILVDGGRALFN